MSLRQSNSRGLVIWAAIAAAIGGMLVGLAFGMPGTQAELTIPGGALIGHGLTVWAWD